LLPFLAVCIVARDSRANSSKDEDAKPPVYGREAYDSGAAGSNTWRYRDAVRRKPPRIVRPFCPMEPRDTALSVRPARVTMKTRGHVAALGGRSSMNSADMEMGDAAALRYGCPPPRTAMGSAS
jgi:hypothetical protein